MSDPWSGNVALLLNMNGSNGSTTFTDASYSAKTVTPAGNAQISTAQSKFGGSSGYFDGSGDYLQIPNSSDFDFGANDFTIEFHLFRASIPGANKWPGIVTKRYQYTSAHTLTIYIDQNTGKLQVSYTTDGTTPKFALNEPGNPTVSTWYHYAITRKSSTMKMHRNGVNAASYNCGADQLYQSSENLQIGRLESQDANNTFHGHINGLRITKGIARYDADFTPPNSAFAVDPIAGLVPSLLLADVVDGGPYRLTGTVDELGLPGAYKVRLHDRQSGRLVREAVSANDGTFTFPYLAFRDQGYYLIGHDHGDSPRNAAIADLATPELMP